MNIGWIVFGCILLIIVYVVFVPRRKQRQGMEDISLTARIDVFDAQLVRREDIINSLRSGQKIKAIKIYREDTGASLVDAKAAVERIEQQIRLGIVSQGEQAPTELTTAAESFDIDALRSALESLISQKNKIQAIKWYREQTGVGLREAKDVIDQIASEMQLRGQLFPQPSAWAVATPDGITPSLAEAVCNLIQEGKKIQAIKVYREQTGVGLREAKDAVDRMEQALRLG